MLLVAPSTHTINQLQQLTHQHLMQFPMYQKLLVSCNIILELRLDDEDFAISGFYVLREVLKDDDIVVVKFVDKSASMFLRIQPQTIALSSIPPNPSVLNNATSARGQSVPLRSTQPMFIPKSSEGVNKTEQQNPQRLTRITNLPEQQNPNKERNPSSSSPIHQQELQQQQQQQQRTQHQMNQKPSGATKTSAPPMPLYAIQQEQIEQSKSKNLENKANSDSSNTYRAAMLNGGSKSNIIGKRKIMLNPFNDRVYKRLKRETTSKVSFQCQHVPDSHISIVLALNLLVEYLPITILQTLILYLPDLPEEFNASLYLKSGWKVSDKTLHDYPNTFVENVLPIQNQPSLIVTIGVPGSGKTTWAKIRLGHSGQRQYVISHLTGCRNSQKLRQIP